LVLQQSQIFCTRTTYGTPLTSTQLDANASNPVSGAQVPGTFIYNPPAGTVLSVGTHTLNVSFTPNDTTNYSTASTNVSINVTPATPIITWSNPANITYATALNSTQLDANASNPVSEDTVPGTFIYNPPAGTIFESVGTQTLSTTFTPTDTANYTTASASVLINVTQATPIITWSNPANITYGTPLSSTQLDATSSVPGYFVYIQSPGTVLNVGSQMLNALFIPNDLVDYYITSATVSINVTQPSPNPALTITKTPNPLTYSASGQTITYTYTVKNTGNAEIKGPITVTDDKFGTITIPNSDTLSKGSSVTGTATYKITDADINAGHVTNLAFATGSFNSTSVISPSAIAIASYEQPTKKEEHNEEEHNGDRDNYGGYGGAVIPMIPGPMYGSPMYGNEPYGYGGEPYGPIGTPNSDSNAHKAKAHLSKHKHKNHSKNNHKTKHHTTKHHKTEKKTLNIKVNKNS